MSGYGERKAGFYGLERDTGLSPWAEPEERPPGGWRWGPESEITRATLQRRHPRLRIHEEVRDEDYEQWLRYVHYSLG